MKQFIPATSPIMTTGFDLTHYEDVSGFLDKSGDKKECGVIHDTRILCSSSSARDTILKKLGGIAGNAEKEKGTYTLWVLKSLDHDDQVRIFERYEDWAAMEAHQSSPALIKLLLDSKEEIKSVEGRAYLPNGKGWLHR